MPRTCPTCANKQKIDYGAEGSDFYRCTAAPIVPEFVMTSEAARMRDVGNAMRLVNLALFADHTLTAPGLNARRCPLWVATESDGDALRSDHMKGTGHGG